MRPPISPTAVHGFLALALLASGCAGPGASHRRTAVHTAYAYVFLASRADRIQERDLGRARKMRGRARTHYLRGLEAGLANLERRHPGFIEALRRNPGDAASLTTEEDVPLLYWTAAALGAAIGVSKDRPEMLVRVPQIGALAYRVTELQPEYLDGAAYELLMLYEAGRPTMMGGSISLAKHYYQEALSYSQGRSAGLFVGYAESICVREQDKQQFLAQLERALAVKSRGASNRLAKKRARWLLRRVDDLFIL